MIPVDMAGAAFEPAFSPSGPERSMPAIVTITGRRWRADLVFESAPFSSTSRRRAGAPAPTVRVAAKSSSG